MARARGVVVEVAVVGAHVYSPSEKVKGPAKGEGLVVYSRGPGGVSGGGDDVEKKGEQFTKVENREVGRVFRIRIWTRIGLGGKWTRGR